MDNHQPDANQFDRQFFGDPHSFRQQLGNFAMGSTGLNIPHPYSGQIYSSLGRRSSFNTHELSDHISAFGNQQRTPVSLTSPTVPSPHVSMPSSPWFHPYHSQNMQTDEFQQMGYSPGLINPRMTDMQENFLSNQRSHFFGSHFPTDSQQLYQQREMQYHQALQLRREQELQREREALFLREREEKLRQEQEAQIREREVQLQIEREAQLQKERENQLQRERDAQAKREQEAQLQREREIKRQQERQVQAQREREIQIQREKEAILQKEREAEIQRQHQLHQLQRDKDIDFRKHKDSHLPYSTKELNVDLQSHLIPPRKSENNAAHNPFQSGEFNKLGPFFNQTTNINNSTAASDIFFPSHFQNSFSQLANNMPNLSLSNNINHPFGHSKLVFPDMTMPILSKQTVQNSYNDHSSISQNQQMQKDSKAGSVSLQESLLKNIESTFREKTLDIPPFHGVESLKNLDDLDSTIDRHLSALQAQGNKQRLNSEFEPDSLLDSSKFSELFNGNDTFKLPENFPSVQEQESVLNSIPEKNSIKENNLFDKKDQYQSIHEKKSLETVAHVDVSQSNMNTANSVPFMGSSHQQNVAESNLKSQISPLSKAELKVPFSQSSQENISSILTSSVAENLDEKKSSGNYDMSRVLSPPVTTLKTESTKKSKTSFSSIESFLGMKVSPSKTSVQSKDVVVPDSKPSNSVAKIQSINQDRISVIKPVSSVAPITDLVNESNMQPNNQIDLGKGKTSKIESSRMKDKPDKHKQFESVKPVHPSMRFKNKTEKKVQQTAQPKKLSTTNKPDSKKNETKLLHPSMRLKQNSQNSSATKINKTNKEKKDVCTEENESQIVRKTEVNNIGSPPHKGKPANFIVPSGKPLNFSNAQGRKVVSSYDPIDHNKTTGKPLSFLKSQTSTTKTESKEKVIRKNIANKPSNVKTNDSVTKESKISPKLSQPSPEPIDSAVVLKKKALVPPGKPLIPKGKIVKDKPAVIQKSSAQLTYPRISTNKEDKMKTSPKLIDKHAKHEKKEKLSDSDTSDSNDGSSSSEEEDDATMIVDENVEEITGTKRKASEEAELIGQLKKRKIVDEDLIKIPLEHGWRRETRLRANGPADSLRGDVYYYSPCGKKLRTYPELNNQILKEKNPNVKLDHFSFSTKLKVGEFTEAKEGSGVETLTDEQVSERFDRVYEKERLLQEKAVKRKEYQKEKLEQAKKLQEEKQKKKMELIAMKKSKEEERKKLAEKKAMDLKMKKEKEAEAAKEAKRLKEEAIMLRKMQKKAAVEAMRIAKEEKVQRSIAEKQKLKENKEKERLMKIEQQRLEKEWKQQAIENERERLKEQRRLEKILDRQRKLEQKRYERLVNKELKKPVDDLTLKDLKPLPEMPKVSKLIICGKAYADLLMVQEFIHSFGHVVDIDPKEDFPSLGELQSALLCESSNEVDILFSACQLLLDFAIVDPGVSGKYSKTSLGVELKNVELTEGNISEILRLFILCRNDNKRSPLSDLLSTKTLASLSPSNKASVLAFLCNELLCGKAIGREIEANLDSMACLRKEKWTLEGQMRKLKQDISRKMPKPVTTVVTGTSKMNDHEAADNESNDSDDEASSQEFRHTPALVINEINNENTNDSTTNSIVEMQPSDQWEKKLKQMEKKHAKYRVRLFEASHAVRGIHLGQDRYKRRYYILPNAGGIYIEGLESGYFDDNADLDRKNIDPVKVLDPMDHVINKMDMTCTDTKPDVSNSNYLSSSTNTHSECLNTTNSNNKMQTLIAAAKIGTLKSKKTPHIKSPQRTNNTLKWFSISKHRKCEEPLKKHSFIYPSSNNPNFHLIPPKYKDLANDRMFLESVYSFYVPQHSIFSVPSFTNSTVETDNSSLELIKREFSNSTVSITHLTESLGIDFNLLIRQDPQKAAEILEMESATPREIPDDMKQGWWKINDAEQLNRLLKSAHPRAVRERFLQKAISRQMDYAVKSCQQENTFFSLALPEDESESKDDSRLQAPVGSIREEEITDHWYPQMSFANDKSVLMEVEDLEEKMFSASLQAKGLRLSQKLSSCIHFDPTKHYEEAGGTSQLVLDAAAKLLTLESGIERRYLNHPFVKSEANDAGKDDALKNSNLQGTTPALLAWRKAVSEATSASQLSMCITQLNECIAWKKSIMKVFCILCRKSDNEERLLLCDRCDRGCHTYCCKPKLEKIPDGDWFCQECVLMASGSDQCYKCKGKTGKRLKCGFCPRYYHMHCVEPPLQKAPRQPWACPVCKKARSKSKPPAKKKPRVEEIVKKEVTAVTKPKCSAKLKMDKESHKICECLLRELENHKLAWPFLAPVNGKQFPEYYKVIRRPMDFNRMKAKLAEYQYASKEEFAYDARLVFKNCDIFNEDESEVGLAGKSMSQFFQRRWRELTSSLSNINDKVTNLKEDARSNAIDDQQTSSSCDEEEIEETDASDIASSDSECSTSSESDSELTSSPIKKERFS